MEETGVLGENLLHVTDKLYHLMLYRVFKLTSLVVIVADCIGSCKSNYHMITTTTHPLLPTHTQKGASVICNKETE